MVVSNICIIAANITATVTAVFDRGDNLTVTDIYGLGENGLVDH